VGDVANSQDSQSDLPAVKDEADEYDDGDDRDEIADGDGIEDEMLHEDIQPASTKTKEAASSSSIDTEHDVKSIASEKAIAGISADGVDGKESVPDSTSTSATSGRIKKKQRQSEIITAATKEELTALFSPPGLLLNSDWNTTKDPVMREFLLENFAYDKNNTLGVKLTVPPGSTRWSFNICPPDHFESTNILLHFNPRKGKRTELVMNDKQGTWGM
jgi:hypothetical protein